MCSVLLQVDPLSPDGVTAANESVALHRELFAADADTYSPGLAGALRVLAIAEFERGRTHESLAAFDESVAMWRRLAVENPDLYDVALGVTLMGRAGIMGEARLRPVAAMKDAREGVALLRRSAARNPARDTLALASALTNLGGVGTRKRTNGRYPHCREGGRLPLRVPGCGESRSPRTGACRCPRKSGRCASQGRSQSGSCRGGHGICSAVPTAQRDSSRPL